MDNDILSKLDEIITIIENSNTYQEYKILKEKLFSNTKIMNIIDAIKTQQQQLVKSKFCNEDISEIEKKLTSLENELNTYPLYCDFIDRQEELNNIFSDIKDKIQTCIDESINTN